MIRVATFNLNNLFDRFNFHAAIPESPRIEATYRWRLDRNRDLLPPLEDEVELAQDGGVVIHGQAPVRIELSPQGRLVRPKNPEHLAALLVRADLLNADVLAVQEAENLAALREFNAQLDAPYPYVALLEGNDSRMIDVGVLSRLPIASASSHRWYPDTIDKRGYLFSRDLLAVDIMDHDRKDTLFTLWNCHLKSKFIDPKLEEDSQAWKDANDANNARRLAQAEATREIISQHHDLDNDRFILCGDMNDHPTSDPLKPIASGALKTHDVFEAGVKVV